MAPRWSARASPAPSKLALLADPAARDEMRHAVEHPNTDGAKGSTLPPPRWKVVEVDEVAKPDNEKFLQRTIADIAAELGKEPADAMLDLAIDEDLADRLPLRQQEPGVGGGRGRGPEPPGHDHRRLRRRRPSRPRRRVRLVDRVPRLLGARPQALVARGGHPPD